jgi:hypothetical protein
MLSFHDSASVAAAPGAVSDPALARLLSKRVRLWASGGVLGMTHLLVVEPGDTEAAIVEEVGFSPLVNPIDGERFPSPFFEPHWDWLQAHEGWTELILTVGNSGFAYVVWIGNSAGTDSELLALCRAHAA